jgi:hypothetical protein
MLKYPEPCFEQTSPFLAHQYTIVLVFSALHQPKHKLNTYLLNRRLRKLLQAIEIPLYPLIQFILEI